MRQTVHSGATHHQSQAGSAHLDRCKFGHKDRAKRMTQPKAEADHDLSAKYLHDRLAEVLHDDTCNADDAGNNDGLFAPNPIRYEAGGKCRDEKADGRRGIEDLLVLSTDYPFAVHLLPEFLKEWCHRQQVTTGACLIPKVYGKEKDEKA